MFHKQGKRNLNKMSKSKENYTEFKIKEEIFKFENIPYGSQKILSNDIKKRKRII